MFNEEVLRSFFPRFFDLWFLRVGWDSLRGWAIPTPIAIAVGLNDWPVVEAVEAVEVAVFCEKEKSVFFLLWAPSKVCFARLEEEGKGFKGGSIASCWCL